MLRAKCRLTASLGMGYRGWEPWRGGVPIPPSFFCFSLVSFPQDSITVFLWLLKTIFKKKKSAFFSLEPDTRTKIHFKSKKTAMQCVVCVITRERHKCSILPGTQTGDLYQHRVQGGTIRPQTMSSSPALGEKQASPITGIAPAAKS